MHDEVTVAELVEAGMAEAYNVLGEARRWLTEDIPPVDDVVADIDAALSKLRARLDGHADGS